ncbi:MAG: hypothetical protein ABSA18_14445, partial [Dehalococcoidia bacterium]
MQIKLPGIIRVISCILAIAAFIVPSNLAAPAAVSADPGIMKWDTVSTPGSVVNKWDIVNLHGLGANTGQGSEIIDLAAANDGKTLAAVVRTWVPANTDTASTMGYYKNVIRISQDAGISWRSNLTPGASEPTYPNVFQVAFYPDDPNSFVITMEPWGTPGVGPKMVETGSTWGGTGAGGDLFNGAGLEANETIRCVDVSVDYGGKRDIAFGTVNGTNGGRWAVISSRDFSSWNTQLNANGTVANPLTSVATPTTSGIDYEAIK